MFGRKHKTTPAGPALKLVPESHLSVHGYSVYIQGDPRRLAWGATPTAAVAVAEVALSARAS